MGLAQKQKHRPMEQDTAAAAKSRQSCPTLCDPINDSPPSSHPWDSPGKNTGVGCHFPLQCMKVKSKSEVVQSCLTLRDPMDCSLPGSLSMGFSRQEYWSGLPLPSPFLGLSMRLSQETLKAVLAITSVDHSVVCRFENNTILLRNWLRFHSIK